MKNRFDDLPDSMVAEVLAHLDLRSRLRAATAYKRFWSIVALPRPNFGGPASHERSAVWAAVRIGPDVNPEKRRRSPRRLTLVGVLQHFAQENLVKSLTVAEFSAAKLEILPSIRGLDCLRLEGEFVLHTSVVRALATKFPNVAVFKTSEARWRHDLLGMVSNAFSLLHHIEFAGFCSYMNEEVNDLVDSLAGICRVIISEISLVAITSCTLDRLVGSHVAKSICSLSLSHCFESDSPHNPIQAFKSLTDLHVNKCSREMCLWIATEWPELPKLVSLELMHYHHLDLSWSMPDGGLPPNLSKLMLHRCGYLDSAFVRSVTLRLSTLTLVHLFGDLSFRLSEAVRIWLGPDSRLERLHILGRIFTENGNSKDELNLVFNTLINRSTAFKRFICLELDMTLASVELKYLAGVKIELDGERDLGALIRLMPANSFLQFGRKKLGIRQ